MGCSQLDFKNRFATAHVLELFCVQFSSFVKLFVSEIQRNINGNFHKVKNIEKEAEVEQKSAAAAGHLDNLADDTAGISDEQKDLEKQALPLCGAGNNGFADGDRPGQAEAENSQRFQ